MYPLSEANPFYYLQLLPDDTKYILVLLEVLLDLFVFVFYLGQSILVKLQIFDPDHLSIKELFVDLMDMLLELLDLALKLLCLKFGLLLHLLQVLSDLGLDEELTIVKVFNQLLSL
jgi:hypothetical protein